jgi:hypothetical protein
MTTGNQRQRSEEAYSRDGPSLVLSGNKWFTGQSGRNGNKGSYHENHWYSKDLGHSKMSM